MNASITSDGSLVRYNKSVSDTAMSQNALNPLNSSDTIRSSVNIVTNNCKMLSNKLEQ